MAVQFFSCIGVNVTHHKQNIPLPQMVKGYALRDDTENKFMCNLTATLLSGMLRIAVENSARTSPNSVYAIATESVNLLFLSVNMIWNRRQYCSCSRALYNHSKTSAANRAVFRSLRSASMSLELRKNTVSIYTKGISGLIVVCSKKSS